MSDFQQKNYKADYTKKQKPQFKETEQASGSDSGVSGILELWDQEFRTMINMPRALMEKVDNQEQMNNISREKI